MLGQGSVEGNQVVAVTTHLFDRVEDRARVGVKSAEQRIVIIRLGVGPLLQLDHHVGRLAGGGMHPGEYGVGTLAGQRQLVLEKHVHVVKSRFQQDVQQSGDAHPPRPGFGIARPVAVVADEMLHQPQEQLLAVNLLAGGGYGFTKQGGLPGSTI